MKTEKNQTGKPEINQKRNAENQEVKRSGRAKKPSCRHEGCPAPVPSAESRHGRNRNHRNRNNRNRNRCDGSTLVEVMAAGVLLLLLSLMALQGFSLSSRLSVRAGERNREMDAAAAASETGREPDQRESRALLIRAGEGIPVIVGVELETYGPLFRIRKGETK